MADIPMSDDDQRELAEKIRAMGESLSLNFSSRDVLQHAIYIDLWITELRALTNWTVAEGMDLVERCSVGAAKQLTPNWRFISAALERLKMQAMRGDTLMQMQEWADALPDELLLERFYEPMVCLYPGGPGRVLTPIETQNKA